MIFLDTNVVSEAMRKAPSPEVMGWIGRNGSDCALPTVALAELSFGIERIRLEERAPRLARTLHSLRQTFQGRIHGFDEESAFIYGSIMGRSARAGRGLSVQDGMIAAIALRHGATLATRNVKDFAGLELDLVNPWG